MKFAWGVWVLKTMPAVRQKWGCSTIGITLPKGSPYPWNYFAIQPIVPEGYGIFGQKCQTISKLKPFFSCLQGYAKTEVPGFSSIIYIYFGAERHDMNDIRALWQVLLGSSSYRSIVRGDKQDHLWMYGDIPGNNISGIDISTEKFCCIVDYQCQMSDQTTDYVSKHNTQAVVMDLLPRGWGQWTVRFVLVVF